MSEKFLGNEPGRKPSYKKNTIVPTDIGHSMPRYTDSADRKVHVRDLEGQEAGRTLQEYLDIFGLTIEDVRGKRILDLGSGRDALPAKELKDIADVFSVSPDYAEEKHRSPSNPEGDGRVAALGDKLPFKDDSFDMVWMLHVAEHLTEYPQDTSQQHSRLARTLLEVARVLKPGGIGYIAPVSSIWWDIRRAFNEAAASKNVRLTSMPTGFTATERDYDQGRDYTVEIEMAQIIKEEKEALLDD